MAEGESDLEKALAKAEGLQVWFRTRLVNGLCKLFLLLILIGGAFTAETPEPHTLQVAGGSAAIAVVIAVVMTVRIALILRELRHDPEKAVARLTKWGKIKKAGFTPVS